MSLNRLQKKICKSVLSSRGKADLLIKQGRVKLNVRQAIRGEKEDPISDNILFDRKDLLKKLNHKVFLLKKLYGFIFICKDNHGKKTTFNLITSNLHLGMHPVGRLDFDSRGANILTNNGVLPLRITNPKFSQAKTYLDWVSGHKSQSILDNWRRGILLDGKMKLTAIIEVLEKPYQKTLLKVILKEGLNKQIRKIPILIGHRVQDFQKMFISNINLNGLKAGKLRELKLNEWISIIK